MGYGQYLMYDGDHPSTPWRVTAKRLLPSTLKESSVVRVVDPLPTSLVRGTLVGKSGGGCRSYGLVHPGF